VAVIALTSAKGSPGVTTAALALTLTWPGRCVLAECDPAGGSILAGYLAGALPADRGVGELAVALLRGEDLRHQWWGQSVDLQPPHRHRLLLPGITDPVQSGTLRPVWDRLADFFAGLQQTEGYDIIVDCGRLTAPNPPWPVLLAADLVLLTVRPTLPGMSAAVPAVRALRQQATARATDRADLAGDRASDRADAAGDLVADAAALALLVTGGGDQTARTVARELATPVLAQLPDDPRTATVLCHGGTVRTSAPLVRAAAGAHRQLIGHVRTRREALGTEPAARP
jgi:hypothetical protein